MIPPSTTISEEGRRTRRTLLWLAAMVVVVNLVVVVADSLTSGGAVSGPAGSSYVTTPNGAAALAGTLERMGATIIQSRDRLDQSALDPGATVVAIEVAGSDYSASELRNVEEFLGAGGRLVVAGSTQMVERLVEDPPQWTSLGSSTAEPVADLPLDAPPGSVQLSGFGSLETTSADTQLLADGDRVVAASRPVGAGLVVWMADAGPFLNSGIGHGGAAQVAIAMVGAGRTVIFDEFRHGFTDEGGIWQILPAGWRTALALGAVTLLVALISYGRRFGPPQDEHRRLPPGRDQYLEAVAGMLGRSSSSADAVEVIRAEARRRLEQRSGPGADVRSAAVAAGLDHVQIEAVLGSGHDEEALVAVDQALATLSQEKR